MKSKLDERQLLLRGNALKHGFILIVILLLIDAFLKDLGIVLIEGMWGNILIIVISSCVCLNEMVINDSMNIEEKSERMLVLLLGIGGLILFVWGIIDLVIRPSKIILKGSLSKQGAEMFMAIAWSSVLITYLFKRKKLKQLDEES